MSKADIGSQITIDRGGREVRGRIVGREDASDRRGMPAGRLLYVQIVGEDGAREVHSSQVEEVNQ